jgi:Ca-activated chloride channel family protein
MNFLAPERLVLLVPVAALAVAYLVLQRRRRRYAVRFTNLDLLDSVAPRRPGWRRHVAAGLAGLAAAAMVVGLARPTAAMSVPTSRSVVMLAVDTSTSMEAVDVEPSRIDAAIAEASRFVEDLPDEIEVGLVSFAGSARIVVPPTSDHGDVTAAIADLSTGPGTAGGEAIEASLAAIHSALGDDPDLGGGAAAGGDAKADGTTGDATDDAPPATIVMLSDGTTTMGMPVDVAAEHAAASNVPVSTIVYGTDSGTVQVDGQTVPVPPDTEAMQAVAETTGGQTFEAATAEELQAVYADIEADVGTTTEQRELSLAFVAGGFVALLLAATAAFVWTGRFL